ncbi:MAG TPA: histidine ammonia-lyase [Luteibaculaceae bacterium]|nr:histidine ammonia-lyase [Luteibaculaceae bacterium]
MSTATYTISTKGLSLSDIPGILEGLIALGEDAKQAVQQCRDFLESKLEREDQPIYGINTGFGALYNQSISKDDLALLQSNLVRSHACGMGEEVPQPLVKLMLLLKAQSLAMGYSGVHVRTVNQLIAFYNADILPVVYQQGSLGASGDLAPLAHLTHALCGGGEVYHRGERKLAMQAIRDEGLQPLVLDSKEGLALLNGTQFMSAYGVWAVLEAKKLDKKADWLAAISLEAYDGRIDPFYEGLHIIRPHQGQLTTARRISAWLEGSSLIDRQKEHVQDPYSFRCVPQVHGASKDAIAYATGVVQTEINSVTDNPTIFMEADKVLSGGNFHGQPLALAFDFLAIALAELGSISERRIYQLVNGKRGLPPFLAHAAGLNSGLMIPQYTAASIASQNRQLCMPATVDNIESSNGQEDHVSMGANAATKCYRVVENLKSILAIELLTNSQALEFRRPMRSSAVIERFVNEFRQVVAVNTADRYLHRDLMDARQFLDGADHLIP